MNFINYSNFDGEITNAFLIISVIIFLFYIYFCFIKLNRISSSIKFANSEIVKLEDSSLSTNYEEINKLFDNSNSKILREQWNAFRRS